MAAQNSAEPTAYNYNDNIRNVLSSSFYYRLKAVNIDGTYYYSDVVFIRMNNKNSFKVLGNPFTDQLLFSYNAAEAGKMIINITDMQGRIIRQEEQRIAAGSAYYTISNLSSLPYGMYILEVRINKERYTNKIIKK